MKAIYTQHWINQFWLENKEHIIISFSFETSINPPHNITINTICYDIKWNIIEKWNDININSLFFENTEEIYNNMALLLHDSLSNLIQK